MSACCEKVGAVTVVVRVRDVETDLVQARRPAQDQLRERLLQAPVLAHRLQKGNRRRLDAVRLGCIDVVPGLHRAHAARARILVGETAEQVVQQALAQGALGHPHRLDLEHGRISRR